MVSNLTDLNPLVFPALSNIRRDYPVGPQYRGPEFDSGYDFHTLVYDAVFCEQQKQIILICPKLLNFTSIVMNGVFTSNLGRHKLIAIRNHHRHSEIRLEAESAPSGLKFTYCGIVLSASLSKQASLAFQNLNCIVAISRNNRLEWIRDWADHHVHRHRAQGIVLFDNASTNYSAEDVVEVLSRVRGLQQYRVVRTPFKFGPTGVGRLWARSTFLQPAMLNLAHRRFLARAAGVLSVDIDELTYSHEGRSIFDATRNSALGYLNFRGEWRYAGKGIHDPVTHHDHIYRMRHDKVCSAKYCIDPSGILGRQPREIHGIGNGLFDRISRTSKFSFIHCFGISTGWKYERREVNAGDLTVDPVTARLFDSARR